MNISDEQIDELLAVHSDSNHPDCSICDEEKRDNFRKLLEPILAAKCNSLLDKCLMVCKDVWQEYIDRNDPDELSIDIEEIERRIEALRHD